MEFLSSVQLNVAWLLWTAPGGQIADEEVGI